MVIHGLSMGYPWVIHGKRGYPGGGTRMVNFVFKPCQSFETQAGYDEELPNTCERLKG
jgi:hypothetical protein